MRYLLDTHVAVWSAIDAARLPAAVAQLLIDPGNDVRFSVVSLFDIAVKNAPGRRDRMPISVGQAMRFLTEVPYQMLNVEPEHAAALEVLPLLHRDPFDRMLVAQAMADDMRLITHDRTLTRYGNVVLTF